MTGIEPDKPDVQPLQPEQDWLSLDLPWGTVPAAAADPAAPADPAADPDPAPPDPVWDLASPPQQAPRRRPWRPFGALLCFAAAILTLFGSFLTLFSTHVDGQGNNSIVLTITSWTARISSNGITEPDVPAGLSVTTGPPLIFAATALLAAAVAGLLAAAAPGSVVFTRTGTLTAVGATAFLAGTTWTITMEQLNLFDRYRPPISEGLPRLEYASTLEVGYWLLVTANAAAIAGAVFAFLPLGRRPPPRIEPDTPQLGIPMGAVVHRLPDEPPDEPE